MASNPSRRCGSLSDPDGAVLWRVWAPLQRRVDLVLVGRDGGRDGLQRRVDACHAHGLAVILDVVYNHLGPEGNYLRGFGPYFTDRYKTPWGEALNYDGPDSDPVRRHFID